MLHTKAVFRRKDTEINATECVVEKVIRLPGEKFDLFSRNLVREWDFLRDNPIDTAKDEEGHRRCLLVVGDGRRDGILVDAEGGSYARHSAFMPNAADFLAMGQYKTLAALNQKLTDLVDYIAEQAGTGNPEGRGVIDLQQSELLGGIDLMTNGALLRTVLDMLDERPEIRDWELDKNELVIYRETEKPSVMAQIKAAQKTPGQPRKDAPDKSKHGAGPEL